MPRHASLSRVSSVSSATVGESSSFIFNLQYEVNLFLAISTLGAIFLIGTVRGLLCSGRVNVRAVELQGTEQLERHRQVADGHALLALGPRRVVKHHDRLVDLPGEPAKPRRLSGHRHTNPAQIRPNKPGRAAAPRSA